MGKIIVITSGKGGVGKTTTAINLGAAINYFNKSALIVDGNLSTPNVGVHLGAPEVPVNLNHILNGKAKVSEAIYEHASGLRVIPSSLSVKALTELNLEKMKNYKKDFKKMSDYIIVDSSAGLGNETLSSLDLADEIIIVTNPEIPAITDALKTIKVAKQKRKALIGVIITKVRKDEIEMDPETVKEMLEIPILGMVPHDLDVPRSLNQRDAVVHTHPKSNPARAYKEIAAKILNVKYDSNKDREKALTRLLKGLGFKK
jgi:septum site-determining protein MinD